MIRLKNILLEEEPKSPSEDPDKMLVKSKSSGRSYYISKDSFDPSKHEKPKPKKSAGGDEEGTGKPAKVGGVDLMAGLSSEPAGDKDDKKKKESPKEKLEKKLGSNVFVKKIEQEKINKRSYELRPDLKEKLLSYDYVSLFDEYNRLQIDGASEKELAGISKKIQTVAIAKFGALATKENDEKTIQSARIYRKNASFINRMLQRGDKLISKEELEKQLADTKQPEELLYELKKIQSIYNMDEHFQTAGAKLENDITVYRSVDKDVIDDFVDAKEWIDNGFVSTSLNPIISEKDENIERNPILKIHLRRGDEVLMLPCPEDEYCIETELTLPRGCKFTITGYNEVKNAYDVSVEYPNA